MDRQINKESRPPRWEPRPLSERSTGQTGDYGILMCILHTVFAQIFEGKTRMYIIRG